MKLSKYIEKEKKFEVELSDHEAITNISYFLASNMTFDLYYDIIKFSYYEDGKLIECVFTAQD